jgi:hypothetical protein
LTTRNSSASGRRGKAEHEDLSLRKDEGQREVDGQRGSGEGIGARVRGGEKAQEEKEAAYRHLARQVQL